MFPFSGLFLFQQQAFRYIINFHFHKNTTGPNFQPMVFSHPILFLRDIRPFCCLRCFLILRPIPVHLPLQNIRGQPYGLSAPSLVQGLIPIALF